MSLSDYIRRRADSTRRIHQERIGNMHNPWPGLAAYSDPYVSADPCMFCGRDKESFEVTRMIDDNILVTLYGRSGNGKTSLLNAGVFPQLRKMQYLPVSVRLGTTSRHVPFQESIILAVERAIPEDCREEVWAVNPTRDRSENKYLWAYFARHRFYSDTGHQHPVFPVIVFDQFEEVYRHRREEAEALLRQISFMMDGSHELESFEMEDGTVYEYQYNFRFVISIREDDLFLLEDSIDNNYLQDMKLTRYRLLPISRSGARDVILKPAEKENLFAEEEKDRIVDTIIGIAKGNNDSISSNVLSLICNRIYTRFHEVKEGKGSISYEFVEQFVSTNPLETFYLEATRHLDRKQKAYLEDHFVDVAERRGSVSRVNFDKVFGEKGKNLLSGPLRILQESNERVELIHDSFCRVLLDQKARRISLWRSFAEHAVMAAVCVAICIIHDCLVSYVIDLPDLSGLGNVLSSFIPMDLFWCVFLMDVAGAFRRTLSRGLILFSAALLAYPFFFKMFFAKDAAPIPFVYSLLAFLLAVFLVVTARDMRKNGKKEKTDLLGYLDFRSFKIWLFILFFYFNWVSFPSRMYVDPVSAIRKAYSFWILVSLFFSFFENDDDPWLAWIFSCLILPLSIMLYCMSGTEYLTMTIHGFGEYLICFGCGVGLSLYSLWLFVSLDEDKKKSRMVLEFILVIGVIFAFYSLLYRFKLVMLVLWLLVSFGGVHYLAEKENMWPACLSTFFFAIALHIFMSGYTPVIREQPSNSQDAEWWWNNVIVEGSDGYRLRDAVDGKDVLGMAFARHDRRYELNYPLSDSLTYSMNAHLFRIPGDNKAFTYVVYPGLESKVHRGAGREELSAQVFRMSRQHVFDCLTGKSAQGLDKNGKESFRQLLLDEERETLRLLEEESPSVVKNRITRQLCRGISCSWLAAGLGEDMPVGSDAFFAYLAAFSVFTIGFYIEEMVEEEKMDWEGAFEMMMRAILDVMSDKTVHPEDSYLSEVLPRLLDRFYDSTDNGQDNVLYGLIVRMQQMAILSGLGDNEWAHDKIYPPVLVDIERYYLDHR